MIKIENAEVVGWDAAIRGMRNPKNSWDNSDTNFQEYLSEGDLIMKHVDVVNDVRTDGMEIGPNDHKLMMSLAHGGPVHAKYRRMITVYVDITAPLYWWKEFDAYKIGTVANSCSTMHKIHAKNFELSDFSCEHLYSGTMPVFEAIIHELNCHRSRFLSSGDKEDWWQMIQLLPTSYNQKRTVMLNYEVLHNIYISRQHHKLEEWSIGFISWIKNLPYSELITGEE